MKVILLENVDRLGKMGDVVTVREGYARNFLIPNGKAKEACGGNVKMLDALKKKQEAMKAAEMAKAKEIADRITALSITISVQAGEDEKLFGSVSNEMIHEALLQEKIEIDKRDIVIDEPIKKLGTHQVTVKVHPELKSTLRVWVVKA